MFKYYAPSETPADDPQTLEASIDSKALWEDLPADVPTPLASAPEDSPISGITSPLRSSRIRWDDDGLNPAPGGSDQLPRSAVPARINGAEVKSLEPENFKRPLLACLITSAVVFSMVGAGAGLVAQQNGPNSNALTQAAVHTPKDLPETIVLKKETARLLADDRDKPRHDIFSTTVAAFSGPRPHPQIKTEAQSYSSQIQSAGIKALSLPVSSYASAQRPQADRAGGFSAITAAMGQNHQAISDIARQQSTGADLETSVPASPPLTEDEDKAETTAEVNADVNLRGKASKNGKIIAVLPANTSIQLGTCGKWWCEVSADGKQGFVSKRYVESNG